MLDIILKGSFSPVPSSYLLQYLALFPQTENLFVIGLAERKIHLRTLKKFMLVQMWWNIKLISFQRLHVKTHFVHQIVSFFISFVHWSSKKNFWRLLAIIFTYHSIVSCRNLICLVSPTLLNQFVLTQFFSFTLTYIFGKCMSNFTKLYLTHKILRILPVFPQFLWNLTFIFSDSHKKFSLVSVTDD